MYYILLEHKYLLDLASKLALLFLLETVVEIIRISHTIICTSPVLSNSSAAGITSELCFVSPSVHLSVLCKH